MSDDLTRPHATATYHGRCGAYVVDVFTPAPPAEPERFHLAAAPKIKCGEREAAFGGGFSAWSVDYAVTADTAGAVRAALALEAAPGDVLIRVTGDAGRGDGTTFTVWTRPLPGEPKRSASPRVTPSAPYAFAAHDGVAEPAPLNTFVQFGTSVANDVPRMWALLPGGYYDDAPAAADGPFALWLSWPLRPDTLAPSDIAGETAEVAFAEFAESVRDHVRRLCEVGQLAAYQPSDAPPDAPRWELVPRAALGTTETVARLYFDPGAGVVASAAALPAREVELPPFVADASGEGAGELAPLRSVALVYPSGGYSRTLQGATLGVVARDPETARRTLGYVDAAPGVRIEVGVLVRWIQTDTLGVAVEVTPPGGAAQPVPVTVVAAESVRHPDEPLFTGGALNLSLRLTLRADADLPTGGTVEVVLTGSVPEGAPEAQTFSELVASVVDPGGDPIERFEALVDPYGQSAADITAPLDVLGETPAASYASTTTGLSYDSPLSAIGAGRASQQARPLATLDVELVGLWGPEARFTLPAGERSPFAEDVELVVVGCEVDLERVTTKAALVAAEVAPASEYDGSIGAPAAAALASSSAS